MTQNCIKLGKWNKTYMFIILVIIFSLVKDFALGSANVVTFQYLKALEAKNLSNCFLARNTLCYLFSILLGLFFYSIQTKYRGEDENNKSSKILQANSLRAVSSGNIVLIYTEKEMVNYPNYKILIIIFLWIIDEQLLSYFKDIFLHLDFWMLELIVVHFFMKKILKRKFYEHQKLMLWFCAFPLLLKSATIILSFFDENNYIKKEDKNNPNKYKYSDKVDKLKIIYVEYIWLLPVGIIIYFILMVLGAYINTKIKWLIDRRYISSSKIFVLYNFIGFIFCLIVVVIVNNFPCSDDKNQYTFYDYFCTVNNDNKKYIDNIYFYCFSFKIIEDSNYEIIAIFLGIISFGLYQFFCLRVIELLTPIHLIFSYPIYYVFNKAYLFILNYIKSDNHFFYLSDIKYSDIKLILDYSSDFVSIIGYLIYLEIIELHFCGLDYNIRINIFERGILDMGENNLNNSFKIENQSESFIENKSESNSFSEEEKSGSEELMS